MEDFGTNMAEEDKTIENQKYILLRYTIAAAAIAKGNKEYEAYDFEDIKIPGYKIFRDFISFAKKQNETDNPKITNENFILSLNRQLTPDETSIVDQIFEVAKQDIDTKTSSKDVYSDLFEASKKESIKKILSTEMPLSDGLTLTDKDKELLRKRDEVLTDIVDSTTNKVDAVMTTSQWVDQYKPVFEERKYGKRYRFYNQILDELIPDGPAPGNCGIIAASTGMGKSAYALNLLNDFFVNKVPSMYLSLEMGSITTMDRFLSLRTKIPYKDIVEPPEEDFEMTKKAVYEELDNIERNKLFKISEKPSFTLKEIEREVKLFRSTLPDELKDKLIVIIDLLSMVDDFTSVKGGLNLAAAIEFAMNKLNAIAKRYQCFFIGTLQLNRSVESEKVTSVESIDKLKPSRAAIKNGNGFLERSRWLITLFRKKYFADAYLSEEEAATVDDDIEISLLKQNNGQVGHRVAHYNGDNFTITPKEDLADIATVV